MTKAGQGARRKLLTKAKRVHDRLFDFIRVWEKSDAHLMSQAELLAEAKRCPGSRKSAVNRLAIANAELREILAMESVSHE